MPREIVNRLKARGTDVRETEDLADGLRSGDVLYMTRIQKERFEDPAEYGRLKGSFVLTRKHLDQAKDGITVMHPLPCVNEIAEDMDSYTGAAYFHQAANGVPVRMALLALVTGQA